jgi:hypothetical protein
VTSATTATVRGGHRRRQQQRTDHQHAIEEPHPHKSLSLRKPENVMQLILRGGY